MKKCFWNSVKWIGGYSQKNGHQNCSYTTWPFFRRINITLDIVQPMNTFKKTVNIPFPTWKIYPNSLKYTNIKTDCLTNYYVSDVEIDSRLKEVIQHNMTPLFFHLVTCPYLQCFNTTAITISTFRIFFHCLYINEIIMDILQK